jgi:DNA-binding GntR family transcriptional regulator
MPPAQLARLSHVAGQLDGVAERRRNGLLDWRYHGRLVARQLDRRHVVIRVSFDSREFLVRSFPDTSSIPTRFAKHMMIVADIEHGNAEAIEDAVIGAWELQSGR